ncbi:hypothetical protein IWX47DRAFT_675252 [Phyllosticta citricarpa]
MLFIVFPAHHHYRNHKVFSGERFPVRSRLQQIQSILRLKPNIVKIDFGKPLTNAWSLSRSTTHPSSNVDPVAVRGIAPQPDRPPRVMACALRVWCGDFASSGDTCGAATGVEQPPARSKSLRIVLISPHSDQMQHHTGSTGRRSRKGCGSKPQLAPIASLDLFHFIVSVLLALFSLMLFCFFVVCTPF